MDDLDDLLRRVERLADLGPECAFAHGGGELPDDGQRDVRLEQRRADLAHGGVDIGLGQPTLTAQVLERGGESVGERGEHRGPSSSGAGV